MSQRILFVNPPTPQGRKFTRNIGCAAESKGSYLLKSVDFLVLSGTFSTIGTVESLDFVSRRQDWDLCLKDVVEKSPTIIVMSIIDVIFDNDLEFLRDVRAKLPSARIYVLGDAFIETCNVDSVDGLVDGIISDPFLLNAQELLNHQIGERISGLRNKDSFSTRNKSALRVDIPIPRHELFDDVFYQWPFSKENRYACVTTVWGCPYRCSYCTASRFPVHYRDYKNVIMEMEYIKNLGFNEIYITDLSFGLPHQNVVSLLEAMIERDFNFNWSAYFHPQQYNAELLELMKKAGCHTIITGIETSDEDILKSYNRTPSHEKTKNLIKHAQKIKMEVCGDFLIGLKEQSDEELYRNVDLAIQLNLDYASFNLIAPLPGTSVRKDALEMGLALERGHGFDSLGSTNILSVGAISSLKLRSIRNKSLTKFYFRPRFLLAKLFSGGSILRIWFQAKNFIAMFAKAYNVKKNSSHNKTKSLDG